jgi:septal ring factor EnvC (AmiA/AmiB activator)
MPDMSDVVTKVGLPAWVSALVAIAALAVGLTVLVYEKVRIPGLEASVPTLNTNIALLERELTAEKQQSARLEKSLAEVRAYNAEWAKQFEQMAANAKTCAANLTASAHMTQLIQKLRDDKKAIEDSLAQVQLGHLNWDKVDPQERDKRVAELRRSSSDIQAQILAATRCEK